MIIKVFTEIFDECISQLNASAERFEEASRQLDRVSDIVDCSMGFSAEHLTELLRRYAVILRSDTEDFANLSAKTNIVREIYERADRKVLADINAIPVMTHNSIYDADTAIIKVNTNGIPLPSVESSSVLNGNTVMYDDWMTKLIIEEYIKEIE